MKMTNHSVSHFFIVMVIERSFIFGSLSTGVGEEILYL